MTAATKITRYAIITEYSFGYCVQFVDRKLPSQIEFSCSDRKNENTSAAMPSNRRMVPWMKPRMNQPNRYRTTTTSKTLICVSVSARFTQSLGDGTRGRSGPNPAEG